MREDPFDAKIYDTNKEKCDLPEFKLSSAESRKFWQIIDEMPDVQKEENFRLLMKRRRPDVVLVGTDSCTQS